ncbi:putative flavonoid 3'-monooxygenase [Helianthus debilis subsp. tardiflorus]
MDYGFIKSWRPYSFGGPRPKAHLIWAWAGLGMGFIRTHQSSKHNKKKVVEEIDQVVGKSRLVQESDIPNLPYLQAIIKELLRLHLATPLIPRLSTQDCIVGGYHIPRNTTTLVNV